MTTILLVEDDSLVREPLEIVLRAAGYNVIVAANGKEAVVALERLSPELVVLDLGLPSLDGLGVLRHIRQSRPHAATPVLVLSADSDRTHVLHAIKLGIAGYMLKSHFTLKEFMRQVNAQLAHPQPERSVSARPDPGGRTTPSKPLAAGSQTVRRGPQTEQTTSSCRILTQPDAASLSPVIRRSELLERLKANEQLDGFSPTVTQVLEMTSDPHVSLDDIAGVMSQDPVLAVKVLKIANSPIYSRGERVQTVHKAVIRIGLANIRQLALSIGVVEQFSDPSLGNHIHIAQFWEHSIACGLIACALARAQNSPQPELTFTAGLLHDLGRLVLAQALGDEYGRVVEAARAGPFPLEVAESRMLSLNHAQIMGRLLTAWGFPKELVDPVSMHHETLEGLHRLGAARSPDALRLNVAERLAHALLLGSSGNSTVYPMEEQCRALGVTGETIRTIEQAVQQQTHETKLALVSSTSAELWPRRSNQLREQLPPHFRPTYISAAPDIDAFRIFCDALAPTPDDAKPTLLIAHVAGMKDRDPVVDLCKARESTDKLQHLPLLVIFNGNPECLPSALMQSRACAALAAPFVVEQFITLVNDLLGSQTTAAAAAA